MILVSVLEFTDKKHLIANALVAAKLLLTALWNSPQVSSKNDWIMKLQYLINE